MNVLMALITISFAPIFAILMAPVPLGPLMFIPFLAGYGLGTWQKTDRRLAYSGILLTLVGSLLAYYTESTPLFLVARFMQGFGTMGALKVAYPQLKDRTKKLVLPISFGVFPGLAIGLGGYLTETYGIVSCSVFLVLFAAFFSFLYYFIANTPVSKPIHKHSLFRQFRDPFILYHGFLVACAFAMFALFVTYGPFMLELTPKDFGLWCGAPAFGIAAGLFIATHFSPKLAHRIAMLSGLILAILAVIVMGALLTKGYYEPLYFFTTLGFLFCGLTITTTSAWQTAVDEAKDHSHAMSAIHTLAAIGAIAALAGSMYFFPMAPLYLAMVYGGLLAVSLMVWLLLKAHH